MGDDWGWDWGWGWGWEASFFDVSSVVEGEIDLRVVSSLRSHILPIRPIIGLPLHAKPSRTVTLSRSPLTKLSVPSKGSMKAVREERGRRDEL